MILALAGQFKQLSHEPEKFRWLELSHLNFSGSWDNCLNCPASARIISSFDFKTPHFIYNISFKDKIISYFYFLFNKIISKISKSAAVQFTLKSSTTSLIKKGWRDPLMLVFTDLNISKESWCWASYKQIGSLIGGSRGGVEGVATPPLSSICLVFCLIFPKIIQKIVFLRSWFTSTIPPLVKLSEERFSDLAVIAMHHPERFEVDEICEAFVKAHPRRLFQATLFD